MDPIPRHRCFVYEGAPSSSLNPLAKTLCQKLNAGYRCMFLNSAPMVAGMRSCLASLGVDVQHELRRGSLITSSEREHLVDGVFSIGKMISSLEEALSLALIDGYKGLFASGDMTWEFGSEKNFAKLVKYEWRLEDFFRKHPELCAICQYHVNTLPPDIVRQGVMTHPAIFVNETLSMVNPRFVHPVYSPGHMNEALEY